MWASIHFGPHRIHIRKQNFTIMTFQEIRLHKGLKLEKITIKYKRFIRTEKNEIHEYDFLLI